LDILESVGVEIMNTAIRYMHRTEDNYKSFNTVVVGGTITLDQVRPLCYGPTPLCFNPKDLNLEYPDAAVETEDNPWCEFIEFTPVVDYKTPGGHTVSPDVLADHLLAWLADAKRDQGGDTITACPICGAEIQSTTEVWRSGVTLSADCRLVKSPGVYVGEEDFPSVYCANDHTRTDMLAVLGTKQAD
tara:strand:+ start:2376 stop:2939 length:564 start_codon:yes stop_codon:yes gene_type:complete